MAKRGFNFDLILMYEKGWTREQVDALSGPDYQRLFAMHGLILEKQKMAARRAAGG